MKKKILFFVIGVSLGIGFWGYRNLLPLYRDRFIFDYTGQLSYKFSDYGLASTKCRQLGGASEEFNEDLKIVTCYKFKTL